MVKLRWMWKRRKCGTILFLAQTDFRQVGWTTIEELIKRDKMKGDARVITEPLMRNFHEVFFSSFFFSLPFFLSSSFFPSFFPPSPSLPPFSGGGKQWRQWERVLSRFIVHCFVRGKVNLSTSGHELRFIRRVKFGDKARD